MKTTAEQIKNLIGLYQFESPYHEDKRKLPFEVMGNSFDDEFPLKVETVEYRGYEEKKHSGNYKIEVVENYIKTGFLVKVEAPNLNPLFIDQIRNFAHLINVAEQTKNEFLETIKKSYSLENPKTQLFYLATEKSIFNTIRLSNNRDQVLFNQ